MSGLFKRAVIASSDDPEQRKRYRVRIMGVHDESAPVDALPWAELCAFQGKLFGDIPHYEVGDLVFVGSEDEAFTMPILIGGWASASSGIPDMPSEVTGEYERTQRRWTRLDRAGNLIEMSPLGDEVHIRMKSGGAEVRVSANDATATIAADVRVVVTAPQIEARASKSASIQTPLLLAQVEDEATLRCDGVVNVQGAQTINVGKYTPQDAAEPSLPKTSKTVNMEAADLVHQVSGRRVDSKSEKETVVEAGTDVQVTAEQEIVLYGKQRVTVKTDGPCLVQSKGDTTVEADGKIGLSSKQSIEITALTTFTVKATGIDLLQSTAALSLESDIAVSIKAPVINLESAGTVFGLNAAGVSVTGLNFSVVTATASLFQSASFTVNAPILNIGLPL